MTARPAKRARRSKYGAIPTVVDGIRFASKAEAKRWGELKLLERDGEIRRLERQPKFDLMVLGEKIGRYIGDFAYLDKRLCRVVEDVKGYATDEFRLKWAIVRLQHPEIDWRIVKVRA